MLWPVEYDFTVYFNQSIGGVTSVSSGSLQTEMSEVFLDVESLYGRYDFAIEAAQQFDWQRYQSVLVTLRYRHRQQPNSSVSRSFQLDQTSPRAHYPVMLPEPDEYQFDVDKTYSAAVNSPHISAELQEPTGQDVYLFSTLYRQRVLTLSADMDWRRVEMVIVSASYACTPAETLQQVFQFTESDAAPRCFSADQLDPEQMSVDLDIWFTLSTRRRRRSARKRAVLDRRQRSRSRHPQLTKETPCYYSEPKPPPSTTSPSSPTIQTITSSGICPVISTLRRSRANRCFR